MKHSNIYKEFHFFRTLADWLQKKLPVCKSKFQFRKKCKTNFRNGFAKAGQPWAEIPWRRQVMGVPYYWVLWGKRNVAVWNTWPIHAERIERITWKAARTDQNNAADCQRCCQINCHQGRNCRVLPGIDSKELASDINHGLDHFSIKQDFSWLHQIRSRSLLLQDFHCISSPTMPSYRNYRGRIHQNTGYRYVQTHYISRSVISHM